jgi:hypothetical protein
VAAQPGADAPFGDAKDHSSPYLIAARFEMGGAAERFCLFFHRGRPSAI